MIQPVPVLLATLGALAAADLAAQERRGRYRYFDVWATSCAHVSSDAVRTRHSIERAIHQSEGRDPNAPTFDWEIWIDCGDLSGGNRPPDRREGRELIRQYQAMTQHRREQIYNVQGNHDAPYLDDGPGAWFREWGDPLGQNTKSSGVDPSRRPFPVTGTWERYRFVAGNLLFLMLSDRNDAPFPVGRGYAEQKSFGGHPAGAVTRETFEWWKRQVLDNQDKIIITVHHHALRDTTTASGEHESSLFHKNEPTSGGSYLYYIIENDDPEQFEYTANAHAFEDFLAEFEREHGRGAIDMWIAGHTHVRGPHDRTGDKSITERRWGVNFLQVAALTLHHGGGTPMSRLITFERGSDQATARVYLHEPYRSHDVGFYQEATAELPLRHEFRAPNRIERTSPFPNVTRKYKRSNVAPNPKLLPFCVAKPSVDLTGRFDPTGDGALDLAAWIEADEDDQIGNRPWLEDTGTPDQHLHFDGSHRLRIGPVDVRDWPGITVSAHAYVDTLTQSAMRIVSKDRIGNDGSFVLYHHQHRWRWMVWDEVAEAWAYATQPVPNIVQAQWRHVVGIADPQRSVIELFVDGERVASAPWRAKTLSNRGGTDLVIGADSSELLFGESLRGKLRDVRILSRALDTDARAELATDSWK